MTALVCWAYAQIGDAKQHYSVERGDALRNVIKHSFTPVVRLEEVLRQRNESDRRFSRLLASGEVAQAFQYADMRGLIRETPDDETLFARAAEHYVSNRVQGIETLVVIPFWEEIERFNAQVRPELRRAGLLGEVDVKRDSVKSLTWTEEQKVHWDQYQAGDRLLFVRNTRFFKRGVSAEVIAIHPEGLQVRGPNGREAIVTRKHRSAFDVGRVQTLAVSAGDKLLIQGRHDNEGFANGDFREVARVDPATNTIVLTDGHLLPPDFAAWTYGHALTTYRAQGSTSEESLFLLGEVATRALSHRQFYVGNTRYRGTHVIYVSNKEAISRRLAQPDEGRELAGEFIARHQLDQVLRLIPRQGRSLEAWLRAARGVAAEHLRQQQEGQRQGYNHSMGA
jgi:ATP-dependent exoDNAse (exonuclease V) alpha subunit